jgi:acyl-CoA reductase-like NAD-dependent aldehyde dehydrogenase
MAIDVTDHTALERAEWEARLDGYVERARTAADALRRLDQEAVDRIVWAMTVAGLENAIELAELAMAETHFGVLEDKVLKNYIATEFLYDYLKDKKSVGVIDEDRERAIQYVAEPIGVVLALLPITNPTSTALFKSIVAAKTRNALIMRPSARVAGCTVRTAEILQQAGEAAGLPPRRAPGHPRSDARCLPVPLPPSGRRLHLDHRRPEGGGRRQRRRQALPERRLG